MLDDLLQTALVVGVLLVVPATLLLFVLRPAERDPAVVDRRRPVASSPGAAIGGAALVSLLALGLAGLLGADPMPATAIAVTIGASIVLWRPATRAWSLPGLVAWALTIDVGVLYLLWVARWTATADVSLLGRTTSVALLLLEAFVVLIGAGYVWELVDVLTRRRWTGGLVDSGAATATTTTTMSAARPFVSLHVPTHNEPPDLVLATLASLEALEYDDYEVIVVDNNTDDPALWQPVSAWCAGRERFRFLHLADWPGFKSGALNEALRITDPRAEVVGIVDADYLVDPDFLTACVPLFGDEQVSFVQTPQDYRDWDVAPYFRRLYRSYAYFFDVSQRSRAERNGAIFGGTMGLIRRSAIEAVGGWDEWCITEDAELSLRLLRAGGRGVHVDRSFGRGLMPLTFEALKRQRFRWCFGGVQILRMHWRLLLPGRRAADDHLTPAQRWAYLVGGLQWFGDLAAAAFTGFLLVGAADLAFGSGVVVRRLSGLLLACVLVLLVLGLLRSLALVRRTAGGTWREALGAMGMWWALGWTVAQASVRGLVSTEGVFLRTPKVRGDIGWRDAVRANRVELGLGVVCGAAAIAAVTAASAAGAVLAALLAVQGASYLAAPINSAAAIRSDLPEELRRHRRDYLAAWSWRGSRGVRRSGVVMVAGAGFLVALLAVAAPVQGPPLPRLRPEPPAPVTRPVEEPPSKAPARGDEPSEVVAVTGSSTPSGTPTTAPAGVGGSSTPGRTGAATTAPPVAGPTQRTTPTLPPAATTPPTRGPTAKPTQAATKPTAPPGSTRSPQQPSKSPPGRP